MFRIFIKIYLKTIYWRGVLTATRKMPTSFNSTACRLIPKNLLSGLETIKIAVYLAAGLFYEGYASNLKFMHELRLEIGIYAKNFAHNSDQGQMQQRKRPVKPEGNN